MLAWSAVLMSWSVESTLTDQFAVVREQLSELFPSRRRVGRTYQGYSAALLRLSPRLLRWIESHLRDLTWRLIGRRDCAGRYVFTVDGTKIDLPRTPEHERCFGVAGKNKCRPQALMTCILHLTSGMLWSYRIGPARASERGHLRSMLSLLPLGALLVADAGFVGYDLLSTIIDSQRSFLIRVGANVKLLRKLGYAKVETDQTVYLWPNKSRCAGHRPLELRLIRVTRRGKVLWLLTDQSKAQLSDEQAATWYRLRWGVEVFYRSLKQTLGHRKMLSGAPVRAALELRWTMIGVAMLRWMSVRALIDAGRDPSQSSFAAALRCVRATLRSLPKRQRRSRCLGRQLQKAVKDNYERRGPKRTRPYPDKKRDKPPGNPKLTNASPKQVQQAQQLTIQHAAE